MLRIYSRHLAILLSLCLLTLGSAQPTPSAQADTSVSATPSLALAEFGVGVGWPGVRLYQMRASLQYQWFGLALEGSVTQAGFYGGIAGRYYPPLALPLHT